MKIEYKKRNKKEKIEDQKDKERNPNFRFSGRVAPFRDHCWLNLVLFFPLRLRVIKPE